MVRFVARSWLALRYQILDRRYGRLVLEEIDDLPIIVLPEVFNPVLLRSGQFLARSLAEQPVSAGMSVLDLGTGTGVAALFAARRGASVVAVDINPEAVRCARLNALLNGMEDRIEILQGDLFGPVAKRQFDLILFNPPFHRGRPRDWLDHAWRGEMVFERFADKLANMLTQQGRALLALSTDGDGDQLLALLQSKGHASAVVGQKDLINEILTLYEVKPGTPGSVD